MSENLLIRDSKGETIEEFSDLIRDYQIPLVFDQNDDDTNAIKVLSLFSGCGGMDLGFEGDFFANKRSFADDDPDIIFKIMNEWVKTRKTRFKTIFANDILPEAQIAWTTYMRRFGYGEEIFHNNSIVELVKMHKKEQIYSLTALMLLLAVFPVRISASLEKEKALILRKMIMGKEKKKTSQQKRHEANCITG